MDDNNNNKEAGEKVTLASEDELRLTLPDTGFVSIKLLSGTAEIFGTELALQRVYTFPALLASIPVFTFHGAEVQFWAADSTGAPAERAESIHNYISSETPMITMMNLWSHISSSGHTTVSKSSENEGARILVCGPSGSGKNSLAKMLINYTLRQNYGAPLLIDLDPEQNMCFPGCLSLSTIDTPLEPNSDDLLVFPSLMYYFGHNQISPHTDIFKGILDCMAEAMEQKLAADPIVMSSGVVINTTSSFATDHMPILNHAIEKFQIDTVIVIDQERLFVDLEKKYQGSVKIFKIPKSGGTVSKSSDLKRSQQAQKITHYFDGPPELNVSLSPQLVVYGLSDLKIFRETPAPKIPSNVLPIGVNEQNFARRRVLRKRVGQNESEELVNKVLAILQLDFNEDSKEELSIQPVYGFGVVTETDKEEETVTVLLPNVHLIKPTKESAMLMGDIEWRQ